MVRSISLAADLCVAAYRRGNRILLAGNGGSAADCQHIAAELVGRFGCDRPALAAIALTTDTSVLTAIANDYGFERLFSRQIEANSKPGDVFVGLSTSGRSENVLMALRKARDLGVETIGLTGAKPGAMVDLCDVYVSVPSDVTARIQECHITIGHIICAWVESALFSEPA
jgi:D-sedoheptulose 7-phosphate isomerase